MRNPLTFLSLAVCLLTACGPTSPEVSDTPPPEEPVRGGTLVVGVQDDAKRLDPHVVTDAASMRMIENMYATLMRYTDTYGEVQPWLAKSVDWNPETLTYTFALHTNAVFHVSGRGVTSDDVKYSLKRIREKGARADQVAAVREIRTPSPDTLEVVLHYPSAPFLTALANPMNAIVDRETVEANGGRLDQVDGGSGPFELVHWRPQRELRLRKSPDFFEPDRPRVDELVLRPVGGGVAASTALRNGELDILLDVTPKDLPLLENRPGVEVSTLTGTFWEYLGMNTRNGPLSKPEVRRAIAMALDREALLSLIKFDHGTVLDTGPIPPGHWAHLPEAPGVEKDPERARALLRQALGNETLSLSLKVGSAFPYQVSAAQVVKQQLARVGVDVTVQAMESGIFFDSLHQGDFELTLVGWLGFVDPDEWLYNLFHSGGKWNQQNYANPEVDAPLEEARRTLDRERRAELYRRAQRLIVREAPMAFLYINDQISAHRVSVQGYTPHPTGTTRGLRHVWLWEPE